MNKQTCKIKRNISLLMLKANMYQDALTELTAVEELEKCLYGEDSVKLGKTYKIIGTLYIITESPEEARQYLMQAYKIFESKGQEKLMKEVAGKLKLVNSSKKVKDDHKGLLDEERKSSASPSPAKESLVKSTKGKKGKKKSARKPQA